MKLIELKMTPVQIKRAIRYGWGAAAISAVTTLVFTFIVSPSSDATLRTWAIASALVTASLGYGVYHKSRRSAVALLVLFLVSRAWYYLHTGSLGSSLLSLVFLYCFVEGVLGTIAHHRAATLSAPASGVGAV